MMLAAYALPSNPPSSKPSFIRVCSVQRQHSSLVVRELSSNRVQSDIDPSRLYSLIGATSVGAGFALWNDEWSGSSRHWTLTYRPCTVRTILERSYDVQFDGDDALRQVPKTMMLTGSAAIPGCIHADQPMPISRLDHIPDPGVVNIPCPAVPIALDDVDVFLSPGDADMSPDIQDPIQGYEAESGDWHNWASIKTMPSRGGIAVAPYVVDY
uniref:Uncharacterized protein n=1 Tax=Spongospora subterranea TaxID=70186 RepID=A0A0H5R7P6_9EUKA|eukprot:CRZ10148.1 hypothetical protein [Spongospora subterranea]